MLEIEGRDWTVTCQLSWNQMSRAHQPTLTFTPRTAEGDKVAVVVSAFIAQKSLGDNNLLCFRGRVAADQRVIDGVIGHDEYERPVVILEQGIFDDYPWIDLTKLATRSAR